MQTEGRMCFESGICFWTHVCFLCIKNSFFLMVNAKQIEFTNRNNFYVKVCACISQRSLSGSKVLHFFFVLFCLWSCLLCGAGLSFGCPMVFHRLIQWALDLVMKFGTWETLNLNRAGVCKFLIGTNVEQPSWVRWTIQQSNFQE